MNKKTTFIFVLLLTILIASVNAITYKYVNLTSGSGNWTAPDGVTNITILVIGGGGGGGGAGSSSYANGGGGAGGVYYNSAYSVTSGTKYYYKIGIGGVGGIYGSSCGQTGNSTIFNDKTAYGGGSGKTRGTACSLNGASGGGNSASGGSGGTANQSGSSTGGFGYDGGSSFDAGGAGGGGAGAVGGNSAGVSAGAGGTGKDYSSVFGTGYGDSGCIAGGGGGSASTNYGTASCGGGNGAKYSGGYVACANGLANSGGGGGASISAVGDVQGCSGGSGIIVIKYIQPQNYTISAKLSYNSSGISSFSVLIKNRTSTTNFYTSSWNISTNVNFTQKGFYNITFYNNTDFFNKTYVDYNFSSKGNLFANLNRSFTYFNLRNNLSSLMFLKFNATVNSGSYLNSNNKTKLYCPKNNCNITITKYNYIGSISVYNRNTTSDLSGSLYNLSSTASIQPSTIYKNMTLRGYCNSTVADSTSVMTYWKIYKNSVLNISGNKSIPENTVFNLINRTNLVRFSNWTMSCRASYGNTNTSWNNYTLQISNAPPSKPVLLHPPNASTYNGTTLIDMNWTASTDLELDAITYLLYVGTSFTSYSLITTTASTDYTIPSLSGGTTYFWYVKSFDGYGYTNSSRFNFTTTGSSTPPATGGGSGGLILSNKRNCKINVNPSSISFLSSGTREITIENKDTITYNPSIDVKLSGISADNIIITNFVNTILVNKKSSFGVKYIEGTTEEGTFIIKLSDLNCNDIEIKGAVGKAVKSSNPFENLLSGGILLFLMSEIIDGLFLQVWMAFIILVFIWILIFWKSISENAKRKKTLLVTLWIKFAILLSIVSTILLIVGLRGM